MKKIRSICQKESIPQRRVDVGVTEMCDNLRSNVNHPIRQTAIQIGQSHHTLSHLLLSLICLIYAIKGVSKKQEMLLQIASFNQE